MSSKIAAPGVWFTRLLALLLLEASPFGQAEAQNVGDRDKQVASAPDDARQDSSSEARLIIVTGSRIPRRNLTSTSPVTVVDDTEVKLQGAAFTEQLINTLPQMMPDQGIFVSNGSWGTATANLRGLGATRTLILLDGRRLMPGDAQYPAPDLDFVPPSLIERVEVLTGGASSVYGSDAVAGVINLILKRDLDGLRLDGQGSLYHHDNRNASDIRELLAASAIPFVSGKRSDGGIVDLNLAYGMPFASGRGNVTIYGGYRNVQPVSQDKRDYSACTVEAPGPTSALQCGGSQVSAAGTFFTSGDVFKATPDRRFVAGFDLFNYAPFNFYQRADRRYVAGGFAHFDSSTAFRPYAELMLMDDRSVSQVAPSGDFGNTLTINCDNPLLSPQQKTLVCSEGNFFGQEIGGDPIPFVDPVTGAVYFKANLGIGRRNVEGSPRQEEFRHRAVRAVLGSTGELARGISYDASFIVGRVRHRDLHKNDLLLTRMERALDVIPDPSTGQPACRSALTGDDHDCVPWDVFAVGAAGPQAANYMSANSTVEGLVRESVANASVTANLDGWGIRVPWAKAGPTLNFGGEYRRDRFKVDPDELRRTVELTGEVAAILPIDASTSVADVFLEARVPVVANREIKELNLEGGYRRSWHDNGSNHFSSSSFKVAGELVPIGAVRLRASWQRAIRAPNILELFTPGFADPVFKDRCAGNAPEATAEQCARSGITATQYGHVLQNPFEELSGYHGVAGGNADLLPEKSTTKSIGVVLQPTFLPHFHATIDWFDIRLRHAIEFIGSQRILDTCLGTGDPFFCNRVHRDAHGSLWLTPEGLVDNRLANIAAFEVRGVDLGASYVRSMGGSGSFQLELLATWTDRYLVDNGGLSVPYDCAGLYGQTCGVPRPSWRQNFRASWDMPGGVSLSVLWRHIGGVSADMGSSNPSLARPVHPEAVRIPAQNFIDLTGLISLERRYSLRVGIRNVFDREPPLVIGGEAGACGPPFCNGNTFPQLYDPLGRYFFIGATVDMGQP